MHVERTRRGKFCPTVSRSSTCHESPDLNPFHTNPRYTKTPLNPPMNEPHLHTRILSRPELMAPVRAMLCELATRAGLNETECGHIALAIDEALTNIIRHGYKNDPDSHIWISVWELQNPKGLRIQMDDLAPHVELEQLKSRDLEDVRPGGLGVHLIHSLMDTVQFSKRPQGGMRLVVEKFHAHSTIDSGTHSGTHAGKHAATHSGAHSRNKVTQNLQV